MILKLNQVVFGLRHGVLGATDGRMAVWVQGCSLTKCPGCTSTHTWSAQEGKRVNVKSLVQLAQAQRRPPSGLTISGGEPSDQSEGVAALISGFREAFPGTEVVLYSGLRWTILAERFPALVALCDVVITGPYVRTLQATPLTGSSNQEVHLLTPLAERLYHGWQDWPQHALQVSRAGTEQIVTVGIPHTPRMAKAARQADMVGVSWDQRNEEKHA